MARVSWLGDFQILYFSIYNGDYPDYNLYDELFGNERKEREDSSNFKKSLEASGPLLNQTFSKILSQYWAHIHTHQTSRSQI